MKNQTKLLSKTPRKVKSTQPPLLASEPPSNGVGLNDRINSIALRLDSVRRTIARYTVVEKTLSADLLDLTKVGRLILRNRRGMPFMRLHHLHFTETPVKAYVRGAYDSIALKRL
jgi:hypothetical protein